MVLRVKAVEPTRIETEVEVGGRISDRKGVNVPDVVVPLAALTEKDRKDLAFALEQHVDWVALSFVQRPEDVGILLRELGSSYLDVAVRQIGVFLGVFFLMMALGRVVALLELVYGGSGMVYGAGAFADFDESAPPLAMPDWSPVRTFKGYGAWGVQEGAPLQSVMRHAAASCACDSNCNMHGHAHATAWSSKLPVADLKGFWGALGCACWAV